MRHDSISLLFLVLASCLAFCINAQANSQPSKIPLSLPADVGKELEKLLSLRWRRDSKELTSSPLCARKLHRQSHFSSRPSRTMTE